MRRTAIFDTEWQGSLKQKALFCSAFLIAVIVTAGCTALLPTGKEVTRSPWKSFDEAKLAFDKVIPSQTTTRQLKSLGFDLYSTPNIKVLNYLDIATAVQSIKNEDLDPGFQKCLHARNNCRAYEMEPKDIRNKRYGNFWLDILNFRRKTRGSGWRFKALFIVVDDIVVEKLWSGNPIIDEDRDVKNPLGPFQDAGSLLPRIP